VRQLCIENIAARKDVIGHILSRTTDIDANVRLAAFRRLSHFAKYLKTVLKKIKTFVSTPLINAWLEEYNGNILELLKSIRLDADEKDIEKTAVLYKYILTAFLNKENI
ncbi:hypothetical protein NQ317_010308, partial [Molorchus minor]